MTGPSSCTAKVVQVTNIAPQATKDQMQSLFGNIGKIEEIRLYPTVRDVSCPVQSRICYVKYFESSCVPIAQHLTNTVFIDRALIVIPVAGIPDEYRALEMSKNGTIVPGLQKADSRLPLEVVNRLDGNLPHQVIQTDDPKLDQNNLPPYPPLPSHYDTRKIEEIRRTILVCDVRDEWRLDDLMDHFSRAGELKYARWAEKDSKTYAMIEFCEQKSVVYALRLHGSDFKGSSLHVYHSTDAIIKPEAKSNEAAQREIEEAMSIVKEAQSMISAAIDPVIGMLVKDKSRRSRSRSRSRRRSRSRSRTSRKRSRSRRRSRSRSRSKRSRSRRHRSRSRKRSPSRGSRSHTSRRSRSRGKRSRSRDRKKSHRKDDRRRSSRSRSKRRSASRTKSSRSRSRSRSSRRSTIKPRSRSRDRKKPHRSKEERRRSRSRSKRRSGSRIRSSRSKDVAAKTSSSSSSKRPSRTPDSGKKSKKLPEEPPARDYDAEEKIGLSESGNAKETSSGRKKSSSIEKSDNMDISNSP